MTSTPTTEQYPPVENRLKLTQHTKLDVIVELPDASLLTLSIRPGIATLSLEDQGELLWKQVHRFGGPEPVTLPDPTPKPRTPTPQGKEPTADQPKRRGRPRLYPQNPGPLTLDKVIGVEDQPKG